MSYCSTFSSTLLLSLSSGSVSGSSSFSLVYQSTVYTLFWVSLWVFFFLICLSVYCLHSLLGQSLGLLLSHLSNSLLSTLYLCYIKICMLGLDKLTLPKLWQRCMPDVGKHPLLSQSLYSRFQHTLMSPPLSLSVNR